MEDIGRREGTTRVFFVFQVMRSLGWTPTEVEVQVRLKTQVMIKDVCVKEMISEIDQDGNSQINFPEFVWLMTRLVSAS